MLKIRNSLLKPAGEMENISNFNELADKIALIEGKVNYFNKLALDVINYPATVYNYGGDADIPVYTGTETFAMAKYTADATYDYTLAIGGTAPKLTDETKAALFGAAADQTHAAVCMIQLPTSNPAEVKYNNVALTAGDIEVIDGIPYLAHVQGLYDSSGTVTTATTSFTLTYNAATYKVVWDITDVELEA